jgi:uncharacterized membrane protein
MGAPQGRVPCLPPPVLGEDVSQALQRCTGSFVLIGAGIVTIGILLLVLGLVGASIEVYVQLQTAIVQQLVQQQLAAIREQLPAIIRPGEEPSSIESGPPVDSTDIFTSLIGTVIGSPLWLTLTLGGVVLIYLGLFVTHQQVPRR